MLTVKNNRRVLRELSEVVLVQFTRDQSKNKVRYAALYFHGRHVLEYQLSAVIFVKSKTCELFISFISFLCMSSRGSHHTVTINRIKYTKYLTNHTRRVVKTEMASFALTLSLSKLKCLTL